MKTHLFITFVLVLVVNSALSQQWNGNNDVTSPIQRSGNVGIGMTTTPTEKLDVNGNIRLTGSNRFIGTTTNNSFDVRTNNTNIMRFSTDRILMYSDLFLPGSRSIVIGSSQISGNDYLRIGHINGTRHSYIDYGDNLHFRTGVSWNSPLIIQGDGNVAIGFGTTYSSDGTQYQTRGYKLAVKGKIIAEEVVVQLYDNWPDYVFQPEYNLRTLSEVEQHIQTHGHLPEVPSAQQVEANGFGVGEMNAILLKKVEELTLYVIELQKQVDELKRSSNRE